MKVTLEWSIELPDGTEVMYDIECDVTPYDPGVSYGPPERCYPPEGGEVDVTSIKLQGLGKQPGIEIHYRLWPMLGFTDKEFVRIEEAATEKASDLSVDDDPPDPRED
jgi:hypothetical protein